MKYRLTFALLAATTFLTAHAQRGDDDDEEDFTDLGYYANARNNLTFSFRMTQGAKVQFGNLGNVPSIRSIAALSEGEVSRNYDDGAVVADGLRTNEVDASGNQTSTPGTRHLTYAAKLNDDGTEMVDENGNTVYVQTGDYLAFTPGQTRTWSYNNASQVLTDGSGIRMSTYSASSEGAALGSDRKISNGIELEVGRQLWKFGEKVRINVVAGIALNNINNKRGGSVRATLHTLSDVYSLQGRTAPAVPEGGTYVSSDDFTDLTLADGTVITDGYENTAPLASTPTANGRTETTTAGAAQVSGLWQIKGAYFMLKLGPQVQAMLTKSLGVQASAGAAVAYVGTNYKVYEKLEITGVSADIFTEEIESYSKVLPGYYANFDAAWFVNERTGLFAGATYEGFGDYEQTVGGRTAKVELNGQAGVRGGLSIKF